MRRYLVVASQTFGGERLHEAILHRVRDGPCRFHVVVTDPTPSVPGSPVDEHARAIADRRVDATVRRLHGTGVLATGEVGDPDPVAAVLGALARDRFDEVILSAPPAGTACATPVDLAGRVAARTGVRVTFVACEPDRAAAGPEVRV
jgi:hypothetical protein